jgi:hypothetical protein
MKKVLTFYHDTHREEMNSLVAWCKNQKVPLREVETLINPTNMRYISVAMFESLDAESETYIRLRWGLA